MSFRVPSSRRLRILDLGEVGIVLSAVRSTMSAATHAGCPTPCYDGTFVLRPCTTPCYDGTFVLRPCIIEFLDSRLAFRFLSQAVLFEKAAKADSAKSVLVQSMIFAAWGFASNLILFALTAKPVDYANVNGQPPETLRLARVSDPLVHTTPQLRIARCSTRFPRQRRSGPKRSRPTARDLRFLYNYVAPATVPSLLRSLNGARARAVLAPPRPPSLCAGICRV